MDYKTLGQNIRRLRVTQGFRQEDLAEKCECSASHIGQIENGRVPSEKKRYNCKLYDERKTTEVRRWIIVAANAAEKW